MAKKQKKLYIQSFGEEVGNSISHGVMSILTLLALPFAAVWAWVRSGGSVQTVSGVSVFCISIFFMFLISTLYHSMSPDSKHKQVFHILDHIFIYVAIAGSYTPVALDVIGGWQGTLIVIVQWAMVLFGVFYKSLSTKSIPAISLTIYLIMGWTVVFFLPLFLSNASPLFMLLIAAGGVLYTIGAAIYAKKGFKYHHLVWHLFIDLAAASHFVAIVFFL
ncbi:MAG: hemolysin III family protein [Rikenellaceae bacterium]|nr:hemolysin III family protein [Rikenellaceae bacterium]